MTESKYSRTSPGFMHHHSTNHDYPSFSNQCSAYFIKRRDLDDYRVHTLKEAVDLATTELKSKGLKVKLSLLDDGLIVDNTLDSNQSWMYKKSELLYFWRDTYHKNIVVIITINQLRYYSIAPYSASIFRLRGSESIQLFLQHIQQYFAQLSVKNTIKNNPNSLPAKNDRTHDNHHESRRKKSKDRTIKDEPSVILSTDSQQVTPIHLVTRTEFDPGRNLATPDSSISVYSRRTYSETTASSEPQSISPHGLNDGDRDRKTRSKQYFKIEYVQELMLELKELRNELAALKLQSRVREVRSIGTSPICLISEAEEQQIIAKSNSKNIESDDDEETILATSSQTNEPSSNVTIDSSSKKEESKIVFKNEETKLITSNDLKSNRQSVNNNNSIENKSLLLEQKGEVVNFNSSLEDTIAPSEAIYENIPVIIQVGTNPTASPNRSTMNQSNQDKDKSSVYVNISTEYDLELQKQYISQLFSSQNGLSTFLPKDSNDRTLPHSSTQFINNNTQNQRSAFVNRLTNPMFNVDKQLLFNTIANQFGVDQNSPYFRKLVTNHHLFSSNKRTFANMIWQMSPEEERALCSSPMAMKSNLIQNNSEQKNGCISKSILKMNKSSNSLQKRQRITWDTALE